MFIKPCPFCGATPTIDNDAVFGLESAKYGYVTCCINGPTVRTSYKPVSFWKADAIASWNDRFDQLEQDKNALDAARYRYLREGQRASTSPRVWSSTHSESPVQCLYGEALDKEIDIGMNIKLKE